MSSTENILWEKCKYIFESSSNESLVQLLEKILLIVKNYSDVLSKIADPDDLKYILKMRVDDCVVGTSGDDFELRLKQYSQQKEMSLEKMWEVLALLIWDLTMPVTDQVCPFCKSDHLALVVDKEEKDVFKFCETCFWTEKDGAQIERPERLYPARKQLVKRRKELTEVFKRARQKKLFTEHEFVEVLKQIGVADADLELDWDEGAGEEWARFIDPIKGIVCMLHSKIGVAFVRNNYEFNKIKILIDELEIVFVNDYSSDDWRIDVVELEKQVPEVQWHASEGAVDRNSFSLDDLYFATV